MAEKTYDVEDSRELPYRFTYSPDTKEVLIISMGRVTAFFENREAFYRFLLEGNKLASMIKEPIPDNISEITGG